MKIYQLIAGFTFFDAISNETEHFDALFKKFGLESYICCPEKNTNPLKKNKVIFPEKLKINSDDIVIYHFSNGCELTDTFINCDAKKIIRYHNITPDKFFRPFDTQQALVLKNGREELKRLKGTSDLTLADSAYNAQELRENGFEDTHVLPILFETKQLDEKPNLTILNQIKESDTTHILFVGRIAPNKKIEDIIKTFSVYNKVINTDSILTLAGSYRGADSYMDFLKYTAFKLGVDDKVVFTDSIAQSDLNAYYQSADVFLCMSEHEGFCVPLLECMHFDLPIIAYKESAVPETLDNSGILIKDKDHNLIAFLIDNLLNNEDLRNKIITGQRNRLKNFDKTATEKKLKSFIDSLI